MEFRKNVGGRGGRGWGIGGPAPDRIAQSWLVAIVREFSRPFRVRVYWSLSVTNSVYVLVKNSKTTEFFVWWGKGKGGY